MLTSRTRVVRAGTLVASAATAAALALVPVAASAAGRPALPVRVLTVKAAGTTARVKIRGNWKLSHATLPREHLPRPHAASIRPDTDTQVTSGNWSGFVDAASPDSSFQSVTASFNVANLNCANSSPGSSGQSWYSAWAGLDGWNNGTVEQEGTEAYCNGDTQGLYVFYEMYPASPVVFTGASPGDALKVTTTFDPANGNYTLAVDDLTQNGAGITATTQCAGTCSDTSAEVISEAPGGGPPGYGLADYGAQNYTNARVTTQGGAHGGFVTGSSWTGLRVNMVSGVNGDKLANAGFLVGGSSFVDDWLAST